MMDYSRRGVSDKQKSLKSTGKRMGSKLNIAVFRIAILVVVAVGIFGVMAGFGAFNAIIDSVPPVSILKLQVKGYSSTAYYADGTVSQIFAGAQSNRVYVTKDQIPEMVQRCFVAIEDERFYDHGGIDIRTILRSGYSAITSPDENVGGSTITQQLIKNMVFAGGQESNYIDKVMRKIQEQYLAIQVENVLTKDQIFEYYVNFLNFGNGAYGIETAAESYFGKKVDELTLSEAAVLAPIALSPTRQNPITHPEINAVRREKCLKKMYELGYCTKEECQEALADDVYTRIAARANEEKPIIGTYSYFSDELVEQVVEDFQTKLGYTYDEAQEMLYSGGISIYTTQDPQIQAIMDSYYQDESNFPTFGFSSSAGSCYELTYAISVYHEDGTVTHYQRKDFLDYFADYVDSDGLYYHEDGGRKGINELFLSKDDVEAKIEEFRNTVVGENDTYYETKEMVPQPQSSMTIIEQSTGNVVAVYGGRGEKKVSRTLNRATNTTRAVGSTFKVLASFLPAIDAGGLTLASVQDDSPYFYPGGTKEVFNWYSTGFRGLQSIRTGISNSLNVVAVKTLEQIGAPLGFSYLEKLGFSTLVKSKVENGKVFSDVNLAIALGGLTDGVTNLELTAAYAAIANSGVYIKPRFYTKILDHDGNVLIDNTPQSTQVMKTSSAWLITDALHDTTTVGTGSRLRFRDYKMPVAGKTGTASKNNDLWFAGFTPYYTCAVWTGYDNNFNQKNKSYQQDLWRNIMEDVHRAKQLEYKEWEMPDSIVKATICTKCGNLAVMGLCDEAQGGSCVKSEYFAKGTVPTQKCTCHVRVTLCKSSNKVPNPDCPEKKKISVVLLVKNEDYSKYDGYPRYSGGCNVSTWDTPYIYHPEEICDKHPKNKVNTDAGDDDAEFEEAQHMGIEDDVYTDE